MLQIPLSLIAHYSCLCVCMRVNETVHYTCSQEFFIYCMTGLQSSSSLNVSIQFCFLKMERLQSIIRVWPLLAGTTTPSRISLLASILVFNSIKCPLMEIKSHIGKTYAQQDISGSVLIKSSSTFSDINIPPSTTQIDTQYIYSGICICIH